LLNPIECPLLRDVPDSFRILLCQLEEGAGMKREVLDEPAVEVYKAQERLHLLSIGWPWPIHYSRYLHWVHLHLPLRKNKAQVLNRHMLKFAFFGTKKELMLAKTFQYDSQESVMLFQ
jgi:hypothetical protein